jgi:hypothetical protein
LTNRAVRNARPRGRLARLVGTGGAMAMATTLLPPGLCLSGASCVRVYANYVTFNAISTDYVLRRTRYHVMKLKQNVVSSISHCGRFNNLVI